MPSIYTLRTAIGLLLVLLSNLTPVHGQAADGDNYLRQIEAEAKQQAATPITTKAAPIAATESTGRLPLGLQRGDFEKALRDRFAGTYVFYERLTDPNKNRIFTLYQQDNRVSSIREQTLRLLSESSP